MENILEGANGFEQQPVAENRSVESQRVANDISQFTTEQGELLAGRINGGCSCCHLPAVAVVQSRLPVDEVQLAGEITAPLKMNHDVERERVRSGLRLRLGLRVGKQPHAEQKQEAREPVFHRRSFPKRWQRTGQAESPRTDGPSSIDWPEMSRGIGQANASSQRHPQADCRSDLPRTEIRAGNR